jgi:hypothetical protein
MLPRSLNKKRQTEEDLEYESSSDKIEDSSHYQTIMADITEEIEDQRRMQENMDRMFYKYDAVEYLEENIDEHISQSGFSNFDIHMCIYQVNCQNKYPFLQYFLSKTLQNTFGFPRFTTSGDNILFMCNQILNVICTSFFKDVCYVYKGFHFKNNQYYLFFDCSDMQVECSKMNEFNEIWLVTMDEIINQKCLGDVAIEKSTTQLFTQHREFSYITDKKRDVYETPSVVYTCCENRMAEFVATFGNSPSPEDSYYYFTDFKRAQNIAIKTQGYLMRYAVFLGKTKYSLHDDEGINDDDRNNECDSIYLGTKNLDYLWALKQYDQQVTLTYQKMSKMTTSTAFSPLYNYESMSTGNPGKL